MYQIFKRKSVADNSPFQWARMDYLKGRVDENYQKLVTLRKNYTGRLDSSHLLIKLLTNLNVTFSGDLESYMSACDMAAKRLCGNLGITASFNKGRLFTEGVFYPGCPEIILYTRNPRWSGMDLWRDWRNVTPIEVVCHPISDIDVIELAVMNEVTIKRQDLAVITIDIPLLAAQHLLWKAGNPSGTLEQFLTMVPLVGMVRSHLNVALFNKVLAAMGVKPECLIDSNLPFAQNAANPYAADVVREVVDKVTGKAMTPNQILDSIPAFYGRSYLDSVVVGDVPPTNQALWALISQKAEVAGAVLALTKGVGYDRMIHEITVIRRTLIQIEQDKLLSNGLSTAASEYLEERLQTLVVERLPV